MGNEIMVISFDQDILIWCTQSAHVARDYFNARFKTDTLQFVVFIVDD